MIDFRYHLVSIMAVFLALAIGIVLGATELQGPTYNLLDNTTAALRSELDLVTGQRDASQQQASIGEAYAAAVEPAVLRGLLTGQRLLIITEPGAPASVVTAISDAATAYAGATVTGQINLQPKFFDTSRATQDGLRQVNKEVAQLAGITLVSSVIAQQQAAQVLASNILTRSADSPGIQQPSIVSAARPQTMLTAYVRSGFLSTSGQPAARATLAVVITPATAPADGGMDPLDQLLVPLSHELAARSSATVVAGPLMGSGPGSPIAVLRSSNVTNEVSTVDDADLVTGQSAVIQALAAQLGGGRPGSYGLTANGSEAVAPSPVPTPSASAIP